MVGKTPKIFGIGDCQHTLYSCEGVRKNKLLEVEVGARAPIELKITLIPTKNPNFIFAQTIRILQPETVH